MYPYYYDDSPLRSGRPRKVRNPDLTPDESDITDGSVTTPKIADGAVTEQKLADGAVSLIKLSGTVLNTLAMKSDLMNFAPLIVADNSTTAALLDSLGYTCETKTPADLSQLSINIAERMLICWMHDNALEVSHLSYRYDDDTDQMVTFSRGQMSIIKGIVGVDSTWTIVDGDVADNSITTNKIANNSVTADKLSVDAIPTMSTDIKGIAKVGAGLAINGGALELNGGDIEPAVTAWLNAHPEATTTVQDDSVTDPKLDNGGSGVITRVRMLGDAQSDFPDVFCPTFHIGNLVNGELVSGHRPTTGFIAAPLTLLSKKETTHKLKFVFYNSEKSVVSEGGWISISYPRLIRVMVPADATYIRVMFDNSSLSNSSTSPSIDDISEVVQFQKYDISSGEIAIKNASLGYVPVLYSYGSLPWTSDAFTYGNRVVTSYMKTPVTLESIDATTTNKFYAVFYDSEFNIVSYTDWINVSSANGRTYSNTGAEYVRFAFDNQSTSNNSQSPWIEDIDNTVKFKAVQQLSSMQEVEKEGVISAGATAGIWIGDLPARVPIILSVNDPNNVLTDSASIPVRVSDGSDGYILQNVTKNTETYIEAGLYSEAQFQIQIPLAIMRTSGGSVIGGSIYVTVIDTSTAVVRRGNIAPFAVGELQLDNGSVNEDKLSYDVLNRLNSVGMPSYYAEEYTAVLHRVEALAESASARFAFMTDLHFPSVDSNFNLWLRDGVRNMVAAVSKMSQELGFSCVVAGGDYEQLPAYDEGQTKQQGIDCITDLHSWMSNIDGPKIVIAGNHEANYTGGGTSYGLSTTEIRNLVSYKNVTNGIKAASDTVYYLDNSIDGIRYLFLSTTSYGALSAEGGSVQTGIAAAIANNENNYPLVVFNHFVGENQDGALYAGVKGCIDYILSLNATIIAWIGGHQHADWCYVYRDVLAISCLQSGFWTNEQSQDGTTYAHTQGTADESAFSVFTVDKTAGKIYLTRFGLGVDREFNYNTTSGEIGLVS